MAMNRVQFQKDRVSEAVRDGGAVPRGAGGVAAVKPSIAPSSALADSTGSAGHANTRRQLLPARSSRRRNFL